MTPMSNGLPARIRTGNPTFIVGSVPDSG
jgi:hypothetical protein